VDLPYLRSHPHQLATFLMHQRLRETPVGGGSICQARRLTLEDGTSVFIKSLGDPAMPPMPPAPEHFFETEAEGLRWLRESGTVPVPEVIAVLPDLLVLEWIDHGPPTPEAAEVFGRELAGMHSCGADGFGAPWPGYIGSLPQDNGSLPQDDGSESGWPQWFAQRRLSPYLAAAADRRALDRADVALVQRVLDRIDRLAGPPEPPARIHGDLWPGNVVWAHRRVWLIDPAAHGGHRETDLAQLALFAGAPYLDRILAAYQETWPLAQGWAARVALHQLHLLLVHAALFGAAYRGSVVAAAHASLRG
jgi:fructosamine-3-kinase